MLAAICEGVTTADFVEVELVAEVIVPVAVGATVTPANWLSATRV
jgi:hypothetical protein